MVILVAMADVGWLRVCDSCLLRNARQVVGIPKS